MFVLVGSLSHRPHIIVATMSSITVLLVVVASLQATEVQAQNNGDIRLWNNWRNNLSTFRGRLEVFIDGKWGTICCKSGTDLQAVASTTITNMCSTVQLILKWMQLLTLIVIILVPLAQLRGSHQIHIKVKLPSLMLEANASLVTYL